MDTMNTTETMTTPAIAAAQACGRIAPLWPLKHFVAVNPWLGLGDRHFLEAARLVSRVAGARMTLPRAFHAEAIAAGRVGEADLAAALAAGDAPSIANVRQLKAAAERNDPVIDRLPSIAGTASGLTGTDWTRFVVDRISFWAASHFDEGQSAWRPSTHGDGPYAAWRAQAVIDRAPDIAGLAGFRRAVDGLPDTAAGVIAESAARSGVAPDALADYFHRVLADIGGWAGYARYRVWQSELHGASDDTLIELLAVRLAWEMALLEVFRDGTDIADAWAAARERYAMQEPDSDALAVDVILQDALERAWQRTFLRGLTGVAAPPDEPVRPTLQAAFCIDVRSEVYRRALESVSSGIETVGFAGFFGFAIEYVPLGRERGGAQCPVLLTPRFTVREGVAAASEREEAAIAGRRALRHRASTAWRSFKNAAVSSFGFVEAVGWVHGGKLASDALGLTRTVPVPLTDGIDAGVRRRLGPRIEPAAVDGRDTGFTTTDRLDMAEAVLGAMSMRTGFARLVVLAGHGATTVNNPHATGLDCGACGGHTGEANARVAATLLNDPGVRAGLVERGISVPDDTRFLACLHDTTTDEMAVFDTDGLPPGHEADLEQLQGWFDTAGRLARAERVGRLEPVPADDGSATAIDRHVLARARDWSQVRPEWGLAGCAAFIAAPRHRTAGLDLDGRSFLHSYDWRQDEGFGVLALIMSAPMVVASWISLQYFGSAVDNRVFGSGNKVLHNVVGTLGVLEGNGGDLRTGLPWQSVHDGERLMHEPLRLTVVIEAPIDAIDEVIATHEMVRELVDNGWLHLFAMSGEVARVERRVGAGNWEAA